MHLHTHLYTSWLCVSICYCAIFFFLLFLSRHTPALVEFDLFLSTCQTKKKKLYYPFCFFSFLKLYSNGAISTNNFAHPMFDIYTKSKNSCRLLFSAVAIFLNFFFLVRLFQMNATMETVKYLSKPLAPTHEPFRLYNKRLHTFIIIYCK